MNILPRTRTRAKEVVKALDPDFKQWSVRWDWERFGMGLLYVSGIVCSIFLLGLIVYGFYKEWLIFGARWTLLTIFSIILFFLFPVLYGLNIKKRP